MAAIVENDLRQRCRVSTNLEGDTFVGIKSEGDGISVCFPLGYRLPNDDKELRQDVVKLIMVLSKYANRKDQRLPVNQMKRPETVDFPIQAYMSIISDYMGNGYFTENEVRYKENRRGKISWTRTIKHQKALPQGNSFVYLDYIVKDTVSNDESLISLVHEYCVYESFQKLGWLYTATMPKEPRLRRFDKPMFSTIVFDKLGQTFNDKHKELFNSMLAMINYLGDKDVPQQFYFGTERFEYVWEKLIDFTFGVSDKDRYFPRTTWHLRDGGQKDNKALEPDTIMLSGKKIYVLDAKYYKYGVTGVPAHLPESTSINKQITYGEYIATEFGEDITVYNAFLMPFDRTKERFVTALHMKNIGEGTADWKRSGKEYERVQGILIDVRTLMHNVVRKNHNEIILLCEEIERAFKEKTTTTAAFPIAPENEGIEILVNI
ncbi:LlaJI family restriction endonuclease [Propionispora hippei]|uniref:LlaJI restriction endonuclease n=1 Tax=Propionispora hippei DSM 15287 TaxID=1123003 RepID=A0A1M6GNP9_9FIRM|nr:LlaJI family restriction endonuclease [Propionispora hippei]SHJ11538.1 LlaJI restriction endonuclease [Propionispora hippei DSM 15287]